MERQQEFNVNIHHKYRDRPIDVADLIEQLETQQQIRLIHQLDTKMAAEVLCYLPSDLRTELARSFDDKKLVSMIQASSPDDRLSILESLDEFQNKRVINLLDFYNKIEV